MVRARMFALLLAAGACGNSPGEGVDAGPPDGAPLPSYRVDFPAVTVPAGFENTQCVIVRLGNPEPLRVNRIHNLLSDGSHHFIVYTSNDTEEVATPFDCDPFTDTLNPEAGAPLMITQKHEEVLTLPAGVAFSLEANQMIRLEVHYINTNPDGAIELTASSTFIPIPEAEFENEADFLFIGNVDVFIPAMSTATLGPTFFPIPGNLDGVKYFGITGHTHQWGTDVRVAATDGPDGADTPVYDVEDWVWSEPETVYHDPPFEVPPDGGFRFTCEWNNLSDQSVGFGESATKEMCFFWAYYYPSVGPFVCFHTDELVPGGADFCCPGSPLCAFII